MNLNIREMLPKERDYAYIGTHTSSFKDFSKRFRFFMHCRFTSTYNCT